MAGIRVVDFATDRAELAGRVLADLGAEVIKVEPPGGSSSRLIPPFDETRARRPGPSLYWAAVALGKRSVIIDTTADAGRDQLRRLAATADVFVESADPGVLAALGLGYEHLAAFNPRLVYVSVTPFGQDGPEAHTPAHDITLQAAGGLVGMQGDRDRPPVPVGYPQAAFHAGVQAAADAIIALNERARSGLGQHLDVSMQAAIVWTLMNATGYPSNTGGDPPGYAEQRAAPPPQVVPGVTLRPVWDCSDGYALCTIGLGSMGGRTFDRMARWLEEEGAMPAEHHGINWNAWALDAREGRLQTDAINAVLEASEAFLKTHTKAELMARGVADDILVAPIYNTRDIAADPQLASRDYWVEVGGRKHPGGFARLSRTPLEVCRAAPEPGDAQHLLGGLPAVPPTARPTRRKKRRPAFDGIRVADFAWVGVGPITSKALADHGALVVHVESVSRPDVLRLAPPFKDNEPGLDRAQFMANFNSSKLGVALDLTTEGGREVAHRLIDWADVVVESFTPGTMARHGLDYASISRGRPDLIMVSTCLRGQTGPEATYGGFGGQGAALAGLHGLTGWPDRQPAGTWGAYTDFIAPRYAVAALASAILERRRSGLGQHIDLSQVEAAIHFVEPLLLDEVVNRRTAPAAGHTSLTACPHGIYPALGVERYVAIGVETAAEWRHLSGVAPLSDFGGIAFDALAARLAKRDAIDAALSAWTATHDPWELTACLKQAGVPAYVVMRPSDLYADPQLAHRGFFVTLEHPVMGPTPYDGFVTRFSATPGVLRKAGPCLGEDTQYVLRDLLGLSEAEVLEYAAAGALS